MDYRYILAIHIIFVVCWFAALFYMVRLFIYATEAQKKDEVARPHHALTSTDTPTLNCSNGGLHDSLDEADLFPR